MQWSVASRAIALVASLPLAAACGDDPARPPLTCPVARRGDVSPHTQCGETLDFVEINAYRGELAWVQDREDAVVLIDGDCTGTWIAAAAGPVVLTAGHCVGLGNTALLAFNIEMNADGDPLVTNGTVFEQSLDPDYALLRLDQAPATAPTPLTTTTTERVVAIQHPRGRPKVFAEGALGLACGATLSYTDLDTLAGSSGAGVLNDRGYLVAVHNDGDCAADGSGSNSGFSSARIVEVSDYLQDTDLAAR